MQAMVWEPYATGDVPADGGAGAAGGAAGDALRLVRPLQGLLPLHGRLPPPLPSCPPSSHPWTWCDWAEEAGGAASTTLRPFEANVSIPENPYEDDVRTTLPISYIGG